MTAQGEDDSERDFELPPWRVQPSLNRLSRGGAVTRLEPKLMDVLCLLARQAGAVVTKEEIVEAVWPEVFVTDSVITRAIAGLRRALEDDARAPRYIETIAKRGYRLLVTPVPVSPSPVSPSSPTPASPVSRATPFIVGQWVRGEHFVGRQAEIREILHGPRNGLWLLGSRAVGKTSLLKQLEFLTAGGEGGYFPLFWDLQGSTEPDELHHDFHAALAEAEERLEELGLSRLTLADGEAGDLFTAIGRLRRAVRERGRTLLLLWDEAEELLCLHERSPVLLRKLRRELQSREGIRTVLASGPRLWELERQGGDTSPFLHGFAPPLYLGPLDDEAAGALLARAPLAPEATGPEATRELRRRSGNHPTLLQLLGLRLEECGDLDAATEAVAADLTVGYFFSVDFDLLSPLEQRLLLALAAADAPVAAEDLASVSAAIPPGEVASRLLHLERMGQVLRDPAGAYQVHGTLRRGWLRQTTPSRRG